MSESVFFILLALQDKDVNGDYLLLVYRTWFKGFKRKAYSSYVWILNNKQNEIILSFIKAITFRSTQKILVIPGASTHEVKRL
jgi:hypothetical protein